MSYSYDEVQSLLSKNKELSEEYTSKYNIIKAKYDVLKQEIIEKKKELKKEKEAVLELLKSNKLISEDKNDITLKELKEMSDSIALKIDDQNQQLEDLISELDELF